MCSIKTDWNFIILVKNMINIWKGRSIIFANNNKTVYYPELCSEMITGLWWRNARVKRSSRDTLSSMARASSDLPWTFQIHNQSSDLFIYRHNFILKVRQLIRIIIQVFLYVISIPIIWQTPFFWIHFIWKVQKVWNYWCGNWE